MVKKKREFDPDVGRRDDSSYWAAALVLAIKNGNQKNERSARANLKRLGFDVVRANDLATPGVAIKGGAE